MEALVAGGWGGGWGQCGQEAETVSIPEHRICCVKAGSSRGKILFVL